MLGNAQVIDLTQVAFEKGAGVGLEDLTLPDAGPVGIDEATALTPHALETLLRACNDQVRVLILGTQELETSTTACKSALARLNINARVTQVSVMNAPTHRNRWRLGRLQHDRDTP